MSGIDCCEDEQGLEQDRGVVPDTHQRPQQRYDDRNWAMPTASVGAPPVRDMIDVSPTSLATWVISSVSRQTPTPR